MRNGLFLLLAILTWIPNTEARPRRGIIMVRFRTAERLNRICQAFPDMEPKPVMSGIPKDILEKASQRATTEGIRLNDPNLLYMFQMKDSERAQALLNLLQREPSVQWAMPVPKAYPAGILVPNIKPGQDYLLNQPGSLNITSAWDLGLSGKDQTVIDLEFNWNYAHEDLGLDPVQTPIATPFTPGYADNQSYLQHGTAVLGLVGAKDNGKGVTGIAPSATLRTAALDEFGTAGIYSILAQQLTNYALGKNIGGQIVLVEYQLPGPGTVGACVLGNGCLPAEAYPLYFEAIQDLVNLGLVVVEAAGNGGLNLDLPGNQLQTCGAGKCPNLAKQSTGAILVGASTGAGMKKASFSNCGKRVDAFAWGQGVVTTGYGDHSISVLPDPNKAYTMGFSGTSAATAMVGGVVALAEEYVQKLHPEGQAYLNGAQILKLLQGSGIKQTDLGCAIGSQPDTGKGMALLAKGTIVPTIIIKDSDGDSIADIKDNCPLIPNPKQEDLDGDGSGDACDADMDNDGISNDDEIKMGLNPKSSNTDGDMWDDKTELGNDPNSPLDVDQDGFIDALEWGGVLGHSIGQLENPKSIETYSSNGKDYLLVLDQHQKSIHIFQKVGSQLQSISLFDLEGEGLITDFSIAGDLAITQDGYLFVTNPASHPLYAQFESLDPLEKFNLLSFFQKFNTPLIPGKIMVFKFSNGVLDPIKEIIPPEFKEFDPNEITVDSQNHVYVADKSDNTIKVFDFQNESLSYLSKYNFQPEDIVTVTGGLSVNKDDYLFVASGESTLEVLKLKNGHLEKICIFYYYLWADQFPSNFSLEKKGVVATYGDYIYLSLRNEYDLASSGSCLLLLHFTDENLTFEKKIIVPPDGNWKYDGMFTDLSVLGDELYLNVAWYNTLNFGMPSDKEQKIETLKLLDGGLSYEILDKHDLKDFQDSEITDVEVVATDQEGHLFIADNKKSQIKVLLAQGTQFVNVASFDSFNIFGQKWHIDAMAVDKKGYLFVSDTNGNILRVLRLVNDQIKFVTDFELYQPTSLAVSDEELVYVREGPYNINIFQFSSEPSKESLVFLESFSDYEKIGKFTTVAQEMKIDQNGNLVEIRANSIVIRDPLSKSIIKIYQFDSLYGTTELHGDYLYVGYNNMVKVYKLNKKMTLTLIRQFGGYGLTYGKFNDSIGIFDVHNGKKAPYDIAVNNDRLYVLDAFRLQVFSLPPDEQLNP